MSAYTEARDRLNGRPKSLYYVEGDVDTLLTTADRALEALRAVLDASYVEVPEAVAAARAFLKEVEGGAPS